MSLKLITEKNKIKNVANTKDVIDEFSQESMMCNKPSLLENWKGLAVGNKDKKASAATCK